MWKDGDSFEQRHAHFVGFRLRFWGSLCSCRGDLERRRSLRQRSDLPSCGLQAEAVTKPTSKLQPCLNKTIINVNLALQRTVKIQRTGWGLNVLPVEVLRTAHVDHLSRLVAHKWRHVVEVLEPTLVLSSTHARLKRRINSYLYHASIKLKNRLSYMAKQSSICLHPFIQFICFK